MKQDSPLQKMEQGGRFKAQMWGFGSVLLGALLVMLVLEFAGGWVLSGVQACMHADELWTHAQKEAVIHLIRYAETGNAGEYKQYREALEVPRSYRKARLAIQAPELDWARARAGLIGGGSRPYEVTKMIVLLRYLDFLPGLRKALDIWARGDRFIDSIRTEAQAIRAALTGPTPDSTQIEASLRRVEALDARLTRAERRFSETVYAWADQLRYAVFGIQVFFALVSLTVGFVFARKTYRRNQRWQARLEESEERFRGLANSIPGAVYQFYARPDGTYGHHFVSEHAEEMLGISADPEGFHERVLERVPASHREDLIESIDRAVEKQVPWAFEIPFEKPSGERIWLLGASMPEQRDEELVFNGVILDITERKEAERILREERNRLETLFENLPTPVVHGRHEEEGLVVENVNPAFEATFGYGPEDAKGEDLDDLIVPPGEKGQAEALNEEVIEGEAFQVEARRLTKEGPRTFQIRVASRTEGPGPPEGYGIYTDITEQKEREARLKRQNERLDQFASLVSHDLRNPLNVAKGRLRLARDDGDPGHLAAVGRALDRMEAVIEDVLTLTWGSQDLDDESLESCHLGTVAEAGWKQVDTARAVLQVEGEPVVQAHEGRLQRLLENLFRNAVEHGGKEVTVRVGSLPKGFFIEDDGPGIPPEKREKVFEAGYSSNEEGTGLGLSITWAITEAHGWSLSVTEGREGGARFEFTGASREQ